MKKLYDIERWTDNRYFSTPDNKISFPLNLKNITYLSEIDLDNGLYKEFDEKSKESYPTLEDLVNSGKLIEKNYVETAELWTNSYSKKPHYRKWLNFFKEKGFNVTRKALEHNFELWKIGFKCGFRDDENNYFIFTPSGINPLSFRATRLDEHFEDWQKTYSC